MNSETLATEMIKEQRASSKRWFIIAVISICALLLSNIAWLIYNSIPEDYNTTTIDQQADGTYNNQVIGGDLNGGKADSDENVD